MKLRQVQMDLIDTPKVRVTAQYDEEMLALLKDSLASMGTINPIILVGNGDRYEVVDGLHRLEEARRRGERTISSVVYEGGPRESLLKNLVLNRVRGKAKASEMVAVIKELWTTHGMTSDEIAASTGLTRDYIEKLQRISQASPSVQEALDRELIGVGHAYELARLPSQAQQEELVAKFQIWRWKISDLKAQVDMVITMTEQRQSQNALNSPKQPQTSPKYLCDACQVQSEPQHLRAVQLCPDCYGEVWHKARQRPPLPVSAKDEAPPS